MRDWLIHLSERACAVHPAGSLRKHDTKQQVVGREREGMPRGGWVEVEQGYGQGFCCVEWCECNGRSVGETVGGQEWCGISKGSMAARVAMGATGLND
jgi:hypothetical protein